MRHRACTQARYLLFLAAQAISQKLVLCGIGFVFLVIQSVHAKETIYVVGEASLTYFPADKRSNSGVAAGMDALFLMHLLEGLGYTVELDVLPWARAFKLALEKPNTLIHSIARNEEREPQFHWIEAYMDLEYGLYSYGEQPRLNVHSVEDLQQFTIAAQRDDGLYFQLEKMGLKRIQTVLHYDMLFSMLANERVDLIPASRETSSIRCEQLKICDKLHLEYPLTHINGTLYFAFNRQTKMALVKKVRSAFQAKVASGEYLHLFPNRKVGLRFTE